MIIQEPPYSKSLSYAEMSSEDCHTASRCVFCVLLLNTAWVCGSGDKDL